MLWLRTGPQRQQRAWKAISILMNAKCAPLEMGAISQELRAALRHGVSLVSTSVHLGSAAFDSFVPVCRFIDRVGYWWLWWRCSPPSWLTGVTVMQTVAANGTAGTFRCVWHQSGSSARSLKWPSSLTQHIADVPVWSSSTHINNAKCMLMMLFCCFDKTNPHYGYKWLQGVGCGLASCSVLFNENSVFYLSGRNKTQQQFVRLMVRIICWQVESFTTISRSSENWCLFT